MRGVKECESVSQIVAVPALSSSLTAIAFPSRQSLNMGELSGTGREAVCVNFHPRALELEMQI
jgi:hypothetical protein